MATGVSYIYNIQTDFEKANKVDISVLQRTINDNKVISLDPLYINGNIQNSGTTGATGPVDIVFPGILATGPSGPKETLDGIIKNYVYVDIPKQSQLIAYDAFVSNNINYPGDYSSVSEAFNDGKQSVYVKSGTYIETFDIIIPNGGQLFGETPGSVIIALVAGNSIKIDGSGGVKETIGTISITSNTSTVIGVGTTFTNLSVGNFILLGTNYYEILTINSDTNLTLKSNYVGKTVINDLYQAQAMDTGSRIQNMIITASSSTALYVRGLRHGNIKSIAITQCNNGFEIIDSGDLSIQEIVPTFVNNGIIITDSISLSFNTINVFNSVSSGITIRGNSTNIVLQSCACENNNGTGLIIEDTCKNINIIDNVIKNNNSSGIVIGGLSEYNTIANTEISNNNGNGINIGSSETIISNCIVTYNENTGIVLGSENVCDGCIISHNNKGIDILSDKCIISNNNIHGNGPTGMNIVSNKNTINGNIIENGCVFINGSYNNYNTNNLSSSVGDGVILTSNSKFNIINGNTIIHNELSGITIESNSEKNIVTSNMLYGNTGSNYIDNGTGTVSSSNITG